MIRLLRVDDSFLYGKKALLWINATRAKVIVLIDNGLRFDYFAQSLLNMACPPQAELVFLDVEEARALFRSLAQTTNPYNCPHGRPTIVTMTKQQIERLFKRIV